MEQLAIGVLMAAMDAQEFRKRINRSRSRHWQYKPAGKQRHMSAET